MVKTVYRMKNSTVGRVEDGPRMYTIPIDRGSRRDIAWRAPQANAEVLPPEPSSGCGVSCNTLFRMLVVGGNIDEIPVWGPSEDVSGETQSDEAGATSG
jgi:hypothetical protein